MQDGPGFSGRTTFPPGHFKIVDPAGRLVPYQIIKEDGADKTIFFAEEVPGLGFKEYRLVPSQNSPSSQPTWWCRG